MQIKLLSPRLVFPLVAAVAVTLVAQAAEQQVRAKVDLSKLPPASEKKGVTYAGDIKAIFDKACTSCHGQEKQKGKLRLDSLAATLKGAEDGKVVEPGKSAESILLQNVARLGDEDSWMPPKDNKANIPALTTAQVGLIRAWIDQGAK